MVILHEGEVLGQDSPGVFTERMSGRVWTVTAPGWHPRGLQARLAHSPGVLDAVIQDERVRLVWEAGKTPDPNRLLAGLEDATLNSVAPRFEDGFIAMLRSRGAGGRGGR